MNFIEARLNNKNEYRMRMLAVPGHNPELYLCFKRYVGSVGGPSPT